MLVLVAAMLVFGVIVQIAGLFITAALITVMAAYAQRGVRLRETAIFAVVLAAFVVVIFVYALGQPLPVWWGG